MDFYISSQCSSKKHIGLAVEELASFGFRKIELTGGTDWYPGYEDDLAALRGRFGLEYMVHNYFPPQKEHFVLNLAVKDQARRDAMKSFVQRAMLFSKANGQKVFGVHPGFRQDVCVELENGFFKQGDPDGISLDAFYTLLDELNILAKGEDMFIAVEHLAPRSRDDHFSFITSPADIERYLAELPKWSNLGFLLDFGHIGAASAMLGFDRVRVLDTILAHADKIFEIHISENLGAKDAHGITPIDSWQILYLSQVVPQIGKIPVVFEWANEANASAFSQYSKLAQILAEKSLN